MKEDRFVGYVTIKKINYILYGQDMSFHSGLPNGVRFKMYEQPGLKNRYKLVAEGYGEPGCYGNGAIYTGFNGSNRLTDAIYKAFIPNKGE